jgi:gliding motility-associated-like protein
MVKGVSCFGGNDGIASARVTGGNMPYSYLWLPNNSNGATNNNLPAGDCAVTITDANGCKAIATGTMPQPSPLNSVMKSKHTFCGQDNGTATVEAFGGSSPYQYTWSTGNNTSASVTDLPPGLHSVTIHDKNGCIKNDTARILPSSEIQLQLSHTNVLCAGGQTGSAEARVTGGTAPYTFRWTSATQIFDSSAITAVPAGTYHLQLDDAVGCSVSETFVIEQPEPLKISLTTNPTYCNFNNGSASADVSGGVGPYRYNWGSNNNTTPGITNVYAGNYELTVTDNNNCTASILAPVGNNNPPDIFLGDDTTLCPGGRITLSPGTYSRYKWQDNSSAANFSVTRGGIYSVEVTDNLGCILKDSIKIIEDCGFIFFPNAFTPNNDLQNDLFGPLGVLSTVKDYTLLVYNRAGQLVFKSTDPFIKWNGKMWDNSILPGTYVWLATYSNKGVKNIMQKGTVTVIR